MIKNINKQYYSCIRLCKEISLFTSTFALSQIKSDILKHYVKSVRQTYGKCQIVFDGYEIPSIKDQEHLRRYMKSKSPEILFTNDMRVVSKREDFLSNKKNKTLFISRLCEMFYADGQEVLVSKADADTEIVKAAILVRWCILVYDLCSIFILESRRVPS